MEICQKDQKILFLKRVAFASVVFSTVAIVCATTIVPLLYVYVQKVQTLLQHEVDFCFVSHGSGSTQHKQKLMSLTSDLGAL